jgi:predicted RNase H-like HicB family nuclease
MRYLIAIGKDTNDQNYSAYSPDVLGCIAVGDTFEECKASMRSALQAHIAWMLSDGDPLPEPHTSPNDPEIANDPTLTPLYIDVRIPGLAA